MFSCDVLIIGGGPAGTSAAIRCAQLGINVMLLERSEFPFAKPGETLHPGMEPLLKQLGVWDQILEADFLRHPGILVRSKHGERTQDYGSDSDGPWFGIQAWRQDFDRILLEQATALGVRVLRPCTVSNAMLIDEVVIGAESTHGPIQAAITIDATGPRRWLAKNIGVTYDVASPRLIARYGYAEGCPQQVFDIPVLTFDETGWTWIARVRDRTYQWTTLSISPRFREEAEALQNGPPKELDGLTPLGATRGADVTWTCASSPAGRGYFLCGDASAVLDPASSHGVLRAVMSGMYAGNLIGQVRTSPKTLLEAESEYSLWLKSWFQHDVNHLRKHYADMGLEWNRVQEPVFRN